MSRRAIPAQDAPNYYSLVLAIRSDRVDSAAEFFTAAGLAPDSVRFGYRPLYHRAVFAAYATGCPNAEALAAATLQLPVHPGMSQTALDWVADRIWVFAEGQRP